MLRELRIENLAIIKEIDLKFDKGMIVLTGETGAGKSIILDGINILIGEKVSVDMIRSDSDNLMAEGVFQVPQTTIDILKEYDIEVEDGEIIVRRELERNGKGKASINGRRVSANILKDVMDTVVDLVGQYSHQMILNKKHHINLIDSYLDDEGKKLKDEIRDIVIKYNELDKKIEEIEKDKREFKEKKELFEYHFSEISEVNPKINEDTELEEEYKKLFNSGKILDNLAKSLRILKEGEKNVIAMIATAKNNIESISKYSENYEEILKHLETGYYEIEEAVYGIENGLDGIETDETKMDSLVDRIEKINKLKKKYGGTIEEVNNYKEEISRKLSVLENSDYQEEQIIKQKNMISDEYKKKSENLTKKRRKIAEEIEYKLVEELIDLNMKSIKFKAVFEERKDISLEGRDVVELMIATNIGEDLKPLTKIVSGGEVSRIMLAMKSVFSKIDNLPVLIFDEIDTGIGGETVRMVASKLKEISSNVQVMCITHSPQIAAKANIHFFIEKTAIENKTVTKVSVLSEEERVNEISRMLAGAVITDTVRKHSMELLKEGK